LSRCRTLCVGLLLAVFVLPVAQADARRITFGERDLRQGMRGTDVRVLQGLDDRLDENAKKAITRWHFRPATKNGSPIDLEAVVQIPFAVKKSLYGF